MARREKDAIKCDGVCSHCKALLGGESKIALVNVGGTLYCPRCFQHERAPQEPGRWYLTAVDCTRCKRQTLVSSFGLKCGSCGFASVTLTERAEAAADDAG